MAKIKTCVDFFSGLGGFSQAFYESNGWRVIRIDYDEGFRHIPNTHIADLMQMDLNSLRRLGAFKPDVLLMSWPCECFSLMSVYHYWENGRPKKQETRDAIALVQRSMMLKDQLQPKYWIGENPNGMMVKVLGKPNHYTWWGSWYSERDLMMLKLKELGTDKPPLKPTSLWGILPKINWRSKPRKGEYQEAPRGAKSGIQNSALRPEIRACIPFEFSQALVNSINQDLGGQETLV